MTLDPAKLYRLAGRSAITPDGTASRGGHLMAQVTGASGYEVFALSELHFAYRVIEAELSFTLGGDGLARPQSSRRTGIGGAG